MNLDVARNGRLSCDFVRNFSDLDKNCASDSVPVGDPVRTSLSEDVAERSGREAT